MNVRISEITPTEIKGINFSAIEEYNQTNPGAAQVHQLRDAGGLDACVNGIFYQTAGKGYLHLPLEKMAALLMHRIAQGQYFFDGNKRTALLSSYWFLRNNGLGLNINRYEVNDLIWGFASQNGNQPKYNEDDAFRYIEDNIYPYRTN